MKTTVLAVILTILFVNPIVGFSQCEILNRVHPDGTMFYYIEPVNFYWTESKSLKGGVYTDKEHYFLGFQPIPFPEKPIGNKLKDDASITLANGKTCVLQHYDSRYIRNDSNLRLLFLVNEDDIDDMLKFEASSLEINLQDSAGVRTYNFKLHKDAIQEQLACFLRDQEGRKE